MQTLDKRISALEQASPTEDMVSTIFLVPLLKEGNAVLESIHDNHGNAWSRRPDETQEAFKDRATSDTPRKENRVALLFATVGLIDGESLPLS